ncbi:MAG: helix-turn-helix transcriptional regulator [Clostridia bacterium]|nr:helix-turn-helix transcriptional regulator [Clostridia bacterium]
MIAFYQKLKELRRAKNITQEQLAGYLCVSAQAVSRWECGTACPDISMLPQIAGFFEITVDELLSVNEQEKRREIDTLVAETSSQIDHNITEEPIRRLRDGLNRYPNNDRLLCTLMYALYAASEDAVFCAAHDAEILSIADRILTYSEDHRCRDEARRLLFRHYCDTERKSEAQIIAQDMPLCETCLEVNLYWGLDGEERLSHLKDRISRDMQYLTWDIWAYSVHADLPPEEKQELEQLYQKIEMMVNEKFA